MFNRKEIKERAKDALKLNYWKSVLVYFLLTLLTGTGVASISSATGAARGATAATSGGSAAVSGMFDDIAAVIGDLPHEFDMLIGLSFVTIILGLLAILALVAIISAIATVFDIFVKRPFVVGGARYFTRNADGVGDVGDILGGFKVNYLKNVGTLFLMNFFISLGTFFFIIPGIILTYAFRMVPYILAEGTELSATEVLKKSMEMMKGNKWAAFYSSFHSLDGSSFQHLHLVSSTSSMLDHITTRLMQSFTLRLRGEMHLL
ncbi:MAG: DUF975 family protein, partial [Eubacteriales bacterium]|nr:DUF975 family protein [Eubacteriales bacterium]